MTALRSGPLPRMAGRLTFMRSPQAGLGDLSFGTIAVMGVPIEANFGSRCGCRFGPLALRETSVYFGWHANPQLAQPMDIATRKPFGASTIHQRLLDLGDVPVDTVASHLVSQTLRDAVMKVVSRGAIPLLLGGDRSITAPSFSGVLKGMNQRPTPAGRVGYIQLGGQLPLATSDLVEPSNTVYVCPNPDADYSFVQTFKELGGTIFTAHDIECNGVDSVIRSALELAGNGGQGIYASFDLSVVSSDWHGMTNRPAFDALDGATTAKALSILGDGPVVALDVVGLNPALNQLSVVKTGQRLIVSCLLGFIQSRTSAPCQPSPLPVPMP